MYISTDNIFPSIRWNLVFFYSFFDIALITFGNEGRFGGEKQAKNKEYNWHDRIDFVLEVNLDTKVRRAAPSKKDKVPHFNPARLIINAAYVDLFLRLKV